MIAAAKPVCQPTSHDRVQNVREGSAEAKPSSQLMIPTSSGPRHLKSRLLEGLSKQDSERILSAASYRRFTHNAVPTHQGDHADHLFLLVSGTARYFFITPGGKKVNLVWLSPGDIFGSASLLARPTDFIVSTEVEKNSVLLVWQRNKIRELARRYPQLLENALSTACDYLVWYVATHLSLVCHSAPRRLAHVLLSLASGLGQKTPNGIALEITNEQLANTANITLFTASRLLSEWQRRGVLLKSRGKVILRSPEHLFGSH